MLLHWMQMNYMAIPLVHKVGHVSTLTVERRHIANKERTLHLLDVINKHANVNLFLPACSCLPTLHARSSIIMIVH